jgi:hypothetical protein
LLNRAFSLEHQPASTEQPVTEDERNSGQYGERRQKVERRADEGAPFDPEALDESAQHDALRDGRDDGAVEEAMIPEGPVLGVTEAELKGDTAKHQCQQHDRHGKIERRNDDGEGQRPHDHQGPVSQRPIDHPVKHPALLKRRSRVFLPSLLAGEGRG